MTAHVEPSVLPEGTVTFLLTDVEQSTAAWEGDRAAMAAAVVRHYEIVDACVRAHRGIRPVEQGEGDSVVAVFTLASDAIRAAVDLQLALGAERWPEGARLAVRAALHTGEAQLRDAGNYMGRVVIRAARLRAVAHGGQVVCSGATAELTRDALPPEVTLLDLGAHRLKDLGRPEHVFQICHPDLRQEFPPLRSLDAVPNNLPVHLTSFIGRESQLAEVVKLLGAHRLVTLTGSGGAGKTRLAARAAAETAGSHADGVWWVELARLTDPDLVTEAVLGVLGVADAPGRSAIQRLSAHLAHRDLLIVLDNCEHVLDAAAALADAILRACPDVTVLATSREALGVDGEVAWKVPPLALPDRTTGSNPASLSSFEAVRLFVDRAVRARPNFAVTNASAPLVAEICARLDGIPLAIELAAARTRVLTLQQILTGLEDRFRLLTGGARGAMPRQQTLEASVAWSHDLLSADERVLFRRLAVFAGSFTLDGAEEVGAGAGPGLQATAVLDLLDGLVGKNLVVVVEDSVVGGADVAARYRMLETVRHFATIMLGRAEETAAARDAHLRWCTAAARRADADLLGVNPGVLARIGAEMDNFRSALEWALGGTDPATALELAACHAWLLVHLGRFREAQEALRRALALPGAPPGPRAEALWRLAHAHINCGEFAAVVGAAEEAVSAATTAGDRRLQGCAQRELGLASMALDPAAARSCLESGLSLAEETDDTWGQLQAAFLMTTWAMRADAPETAREWAGRTLAITAHTGNQLFAAWTHVTEAFVALRTGELPAAQAIAQRGSELARGVRDHALDGWAGGALAEAELLRGSADRALGLVEPAITECVAAAAYIAWPLLVTLRARALRALDNPEAAGVAAEAYAAATQVGDPWQRGPAALLQARFLIVSGCLDDVEALLADARACGTLLGSQWLLAAADHVAGLGESARGYHDRAEHLHHAALAVQVRHGYQLAIVDSLEALAGIAATQESWGEAARLLGATAARRQQLSYVDGRASVLPAEARARDALGDAAYEAAVTDGSELTIEAAVAYATRARGERKRPSTGWASLTPTELEVARLAADGLSNPEICKKMFIAMGTTKIHLSNIYAKLGVANRTQLTAALTRREAERQG